MPVYKKLVRDRIPEIIAKTGNSFKARTLDKPEYVESLKRKLQEELDEYLTAGTDEEALEEMADLLELMEVLAELHNSSIDEVEEIRKEKAEKRGSFRERIYLIEVED
ncbi:nucleoside triphosphate pyrophosphohydrolase [Thalassobacillus pellis]|uniref:nucleoside triphosphate pyrophosphohydrolase n=1 Tax=Thalassobacillus pellis TaxID=748008 RepID=UPI001960C6E1|nr:nucleoside triphosphate pyrophosphohydrolase [Thalassobacillus pellis]MBM7553531.1 putative house-cleaning noncanonical NTP pyrophosphatase (MazG superfamily) [Thalassobacillus pellis]